MLILTAILLTVLVLGLSGLSLYSLGRLTVLDDDNWFHFGLDL